MVNNRDMAEHDTLFSVIGMLKARKEGIPDLDIPGEDTLSIDFLLSYIKDEIDRWEAYYNREFPEKT
jgi:hypothetical protein